MDTDIVTATFILPVCRESLVTPNERELLGHLGLTSEYAVDFALNHWLLLFENNPVNVYETVHNEISELVHASFSHESHHKLDEYLENNIEVVADMMVRIHEDLKPALGMLPAEDRDEQVLTYLVASDVGKQAMSVEFGFMPQEGEERL